MSVPELQHPPSSRSGKTFACTSCYKCLHTLLHYHITCRVLPGCGNTQAQLLSEVGYVGGRSRSCNGLCPHDLVELSPVLAGTNVITLCCNNNSTRGVLTGRCSILPKSFYEDDYVGGRSGAATASVLTIWSNYRHQQLLLMSFLPVALPQHSPGPGRTR